jgi:hypothetical protein
MTDLLLYINNSVTDSPMPAGTWIAVDPTTDGFIFSQGGTGVADGSPLPSEATLNRCLVLLDPVNPVYVPKYFLSDYSSNLLKEIKLAGNQNKRYAFAAEFNGATATEPSLEVWDTIAMDSIVSPALGAGTPAASWYLAVSTNLALPGVNWAGTPLAGDGASNILLLNGGLGALTGATTLYFNFKIRIPGGYLVPAVHTPTLAIVYTTN